MNNPIIAGRIARLQEKLRELGYDAAMIYDRENLIYFAGVDDLEGAGMAIPAEDKPEIFVLFMEAQHVKELSGLDKVTAYMFPQDNQSTMMAKWVKAQGWKAPKLAFTRYFISLKDYQCLRDAAPDMQVCDIATLCYQLRSVKDEGELEKMRFASRALAAGMQAAFDAAQPGVTEVEVLAEAERAMLRAGSQGSSFRMQVLSHERQLMHHPYASTAKLRDNAPVVIHLGASYEGYTSKMCRTIFLGEPNPESVRVYEVLKGAQKAAVKALVPGATCNDVYEAATAYVNEQGLGRAWVMEHIGYGVGIRQSEFYPVLAKGSPVKIEENMVVDMLLPTIFIPHVGGPRITDVIAVKKDGVEYLTQFSQETVIKK